MTIKILCSCGAKFAFDLEPGIACVEGAVLCPACGANQTAAANEELARRLTASSSPAVSARASVPAVVAPLGGPMRIMSPPPAAGSASLRVAGGGGTETAASPAAAASSAAEPEKSEACAKHAGSPAAAHCFVCQKPICLDCMAQFGYLCSAYCKEMAERKKIEVPFYAHQKTVLREAENRKGSRFLMALAAAVVVLIGFSTLYKFVLSKPKEAYVLEGSKSSPWFFSQWVAPGNLLLASADRAALHEASSGKEIWTTDLKTGSSGTANKGRVEHGTGRDDLRGKVVGRDVWLFLGNRAVRLEIASGKKKAEVPLPENASETYLGDDGFLAMVEGSIGPRSVSLLDLESGKMETVTLNERSLKNVALSARAAILAPGASDLDNTAPECSREFFVSENSAVQMQSRLLEYRIEAAGRAKPKGPAIIDSENLRASQGTAAAEEFLNQSKEPATEDQSRYAITLKRVIGGGAPWSGEVVGAPVFFPLRSIDLLAAGKTLYAFARNGQKLWEAKLNYPVAPRYIRAATEEVPALEAGGKVYFFDQSTVTAFEPRTGNVKWRIQAVGTSQIAADSNGKLYVVATTADPGQLNPSRDLALSNKIKPLLLKLDATTGATLWDNVGTADRVYLSGKFLYGCRSQVSGVDMFSQETSHGEFSAPVHHRVFRLNPKNGKELWEYYRPQPPLGTEVKGSEIFLRYGEGLRALKFFAL